MNAFKYSPRKRQRRRWIYTILMIVCIVGFWWFENFYTPDPYSGGSEAHQTPFPEAYVPSFSQGEYVRHDHYELAYSERHEQAAWVAYVLSPEHLTYEDRTRPFFVEDPRVRTKSADWRNYRGSGFDRGHLCPAGDRRFSETAYNQTFYTSNISPQDPEFNAGIWNDLEQQVRTWCKRYGTVYVITGGVLEDGLPSIGEEDVTVPEYFYKVVFRGSGQDLRVAGFLFPNRSLNGGLDSYRVPLDRIEQLSGVDFFPNWDLERQEQLEAGIVREHWPLSRSIR